MRATRYLNRIEEEEGLTQALIDIMIGCSSFIQVWGISTHSVVEYRPLIHSGSLRLR